MSISRKKILSTLIAAFLLANANATNAQPPRRESERNIDYNAVVALDDDQTIADPVYESENAEEIALLANSGASTVTNATIRKSGSPTGRSDAYDFYGVNAAALARGGATLNLLGGSVETNAGYASGLFAYGGGVINAENLSIKTTDHNSGGVMVTGGGEINAKNLTIETEGGSSAAIRSDRGGGKLTATGGRYQTNGPGSPVIYSTAEIVVNDAELISTRSEGAIIEGKNSITLNRTTLEDDNNVLHGKSTTYKNVFIYQSFSGDAQVGLAEFNATDSKFVTKKGDSIYVTNTACRIKLKNNEFINEDEQGWFLRAQREGWGRRGQNGGDVELELDAQTVNGNIYLDNISTLVARFSNGTRFIGAINNANTAKRVEITLDADSVWELTGDSYVSVLTNADANNDNIKLNGYRLIIGAEDIADDNLPDLASDDQFGPPPRPDGEGRQAGRPPRRPGREGDQFGPPPRPDGEGRPPRRPEREGDQFGPPPRPDGEGRQGRRPPRRPDQEGNENDPPPRPDNE